MRFQIFGSCGFTIRFFIRCAIQLSPSLTTDRMYSAFNNSLNSTLHNLEHCQRMQAEQISCEKHQGSLDVNYSNAISTLWETKLPVLESKKIQIPKKLKFSHALQVFCRLFLLPQHQTLRVNS